MRKPTILQRLVSLAETDRDHGCTRRGLPARYNVENGLRKQAAAFVTAETTALRTNIGWQIRVSS